MGVLGRCTVPRDIGSRARGQVHSGAWQWKLIGMEEIATSRHSAAEAAEPRLGEPTRAWQGEWR